MTTYNTGNLTFTCFLFRVIWDNLCEISKINI